MAIQYLNTDFKPYYEYGQDDNSDYILNSDFNEFSFFGKDNLFTPERINQPSYDDIMDWLNSIKIPQQNESNVKESNNPPENNIVQNVNVTNQVSLGKFNVSKALDRLHYLTNFVLKTPDPKTWTKKGTTDVGHYCGRAIRMAMEAGGLSTKGRPQYGGDYGDYLLKHGWERISSSQTQFQPGDICVSHGIGRMNKNGHHMGHISMYDGSRWVSDYVQSGWKQFKNAKEGTNTFFYRYKG